MLNPTLRTPPSLFFPLLAAVAVAVLAWSLMSGSVPLTASQVWSALVRSEPSLAGDVVRELRLPRAMSALAVGGLLAVSGALLQALLRNPLADPYVLGVSGGASVTALLAILAGWTAAAVDGAAAVGAFATCVLVFALSHGEGGWTPARLLLTGVVVASGAGAIVSLLLALSDDFRLRGMVFWLLGDVSRGERWTWLVSLLVATTLVSTLLGRHVNVLARGEIQAASVGMPVRGFQICIFALTSFLTGCAVSAAGSIGFVGLVTPHLVRLGVGTDHRILLPASALLGGVLLMAADLAARTIIAPRQLPVGALTALVGVPLFLLLMSRRAR